LLEEHKRVGPGGHSPAHESAARKPCSSRAVIWRPYIRPCAGILKLEIGHFFGSATMASPGPCRLTANLCRNAQNGRGRGTAQNKCAQRVAMATPDNGSYRTQ
jgi:hypothetical protein